MSEATNEQIIEQDIKEFREARDRLRREIDITNTNARMGRIFQSAMDMVGDDKFSAEITGQDGVTIRVSDMRIGMKKNSGSSDQDSARIVITNPDRKISHELLLHRGFDQTVWNADYLDHEYRVLPNGEVKHDYLWRKSEGKNSTFNPEQAFDMLPEIVAVHNMMQSFKPKQ